MKRVAALIAAAVVALCVTACGERGEPVGTDVSPYPVTVQGAGDQATVLTSAPRRIAPLDPAMATLLIELDAQEQLVGLPRPGGSPSIWRLNGGALVRALVRLHPDLIVASSAADPLDLARAGRETKAAVYQIPEESVKDLERGITQLALLTGHAVAGRSLIRGNRRAARQVEAALRAKPVLRVFLDTGGFTTVSTKTLISDVIRIGHGQNVVGPRPEPGVFSLRRLARLDPQVYLTTDRTTTLRYLRSDRRTRRLTAVRRGRVYFIPPRYLRPNGDLVERLLGMARLLHPDAFR
jgi:ABC-type Fe3+-hydroxamate transport system substrate-binding protein